MIGLGAVSRCTLPLLFKHVPASASRYTVIDFADVADNARWVREQGMFDPARLVFIDETLHEHGYGAGPGAAFRAACG